VTFVEEIRQRASELQRRIVFPEGGDERVVSAAREIVRTGMANPLLLVDGERQATAVRLAGLPAIPFEGDSALEYGHRLASPAQCTPLPMSCAAPSETSDWLLR